MTTTSPTYPTLFEQFIREECTPGVRRLILEAAAANRSVTFEFNRFNVTLDLETGRANVDDELDTSPVGSFDLPLSELLAVLTAAPDQPRSAE